MYAAWEGRSTISIHSSAKPETPLNKLFICKPRISIHSSAKPETQVEMAFNSIGIISIHSSAKPETYLNKKKGYKCQISIHSSAKPETAIITNFYLYPTHFLIQINQYFIFSTPFLHQSPYHNAPFPVRIP